MPTNPQDYAPPPQGTFTSPSVPQSQLPRGGTGTERRKGPRKQRTPTRTAVYIERLLLRFSLEERRAIYSLLRSVCEPTIGEEPKP